MKTNLTLSVDEDVVRRARERVRTTGKSLNQVIREYLNQLAGDADPQDWVGRWEQASRAARGDSRGWKFDRDELYEDRTKLP